MCCCLPQFRSFYKAQLVLGSICLGVECLILLWLGTSVRGAQKEGRAWCVPGASAPLTARSAQWHERRCCVASYCLLAPACTTLQVHSRMPSCVLDRPPAPPFLVPQVQAAALLCRHRRRVPGHRRDILGDICRHAGRHAGAARLRVPLGRHGGAGVCAGGWVRCGRRPAAAARGREGGRRLLRVNLLGAAARGWP